MTEKIPVGISSCLLGQEVRYDGGHKRDTYITDTLANYFTFIAFCPEVGIGMSIPRPPIQLQTKNNSTHCVDVKQPNKDYTQQLRDFADQQQITLQHLCGYILKKDSPSCGMAQVKLYYHTMPERKGIGIFARQMMHNNPCLPVAEEATLDIPALRENFIQRVYVMHRWQQLIRQGVTAQSLIEFHARHKYIIMSRGDYREAGALLARLDKQNLQQTAEHYILQVMTRLKTVSSRQQQVNVLQHIQGYFKKALDIEDKAELGRVIERYRQGEIALNEPITLLQQHCKKYPQPYINKSYYLYPYPKELNLMNAV